MLVGLQHHVSEQVGPRQHAGDAVHLVLKAVLALSVADQPVLALVLGDGLYADAVAHLDLIGREEP